MSWFALQRLERTGTFGAPLATHGTASADPDSETGWVHVRREVEVICDSLTPYRCTPSDQGKHSFSYWSWGHCVHK